MGLPTETYGTIGLTPNTMLPAPLPWNELGMKEALCMSQRKGFSREKAAAEKLACGRDFEGQANDIAVHGNHGTSEILRNDVLAAHEIANPKDRAEYGVMFGCYRPFTTPFLLRDYIRLLDILDVDYTWLEKEYCCGLPLVVDNPEKGYAQGSRFIRKNFELAKAKGAKEMVYCCVACAHAARHVFADSGGQHRYILDLLLDRVEGMASKADPMTLGYFEGCHSFYRACYPGADLDWKRYRQSLERIRGLSLVDLPSKLCCKKSTEKIIQLALDKNLDTILCPCNACYRTLKATAKGRLAVLTYPQVLLACMDFDA